MKILKSILFIIFVSIAIQSPQAAEIYRATDNEVIDFLEKGLEDNWFGSYYDDGESNNHKNGYMSEEFKFILNSKQEELFYSDTNIYLSFVTDKDEDKYIFSLKQIFQTSAPFNFIYDHFDAVGANGFMNTSSQLTNSQLNYSENMNGETTEKSTPNIEYTLNDYFGFLAWIKNENLQINDSILVKGIDSGNILLKEFTILDNKEKIINGVIKKIYKISDNDNFIIYAYAGESKILSGNLPFGDLPIEFRLEPKDNATDISYIADLFVLNSIQLDESIHKNETMSKELEGKEIKGIVYQIIGDYKNSFVEATPSQHVNLNKEKWRLIYLGEHKLFSYEKVLNEEVIETTKFKNENNELNEITLDLIKKQILLNDETLNDLEINQIINEISDREKITHIAEGIENNIAYSSEIEEFTDPIEILERGRGDCTEISDLFTALLKSIGIPARKVTGYAGGLLYGGVYSFGGHQWNEVGIEGEWIPIDPTWMTFVEGSLSHIKTNKNDIYENLEKKFKLQAKSVKLKDGTIIHFSQDGKIKYNFENKIE